MYAEKSLPHTCMRSSYHGQASNGKSFALKEVSESCRSLKALESFTYGHSAVAKPYPVHYLKFFLSIDFKLTYLKINFVSSKMRLSLTF